MNVDSGFRHRPLACTVDLFFKMPNVRGGDGGGAGSYAFRKMAVVADTAERNNRYGDRRRYPFDQIVIVAERLSVAIDTLDEQLTRATVFDFSRPLDGVASGDLPTAFEDNIQCAIVVSDGIDIHDDGLAAENLCCLRYKPGFSTAAVLILTLSAPF